MMQWIHQDRSERGASAVEYALLLAGIAAVIVGIVYVLGVSTKGAFDSHCSNLKDEKPTTQCE